MTQYTVPDALPFPDSGDEIAPLEEWLEDQAIAVQTALLRPAVFNSAEQRDAAIPQPRVGMTVYRNDQQWREMYLDPTSIPFPGQVAGWYPVEGVLPSYSSSTPRDTFPTQTGVNTTSTPLKTSTAPSVMRGVGPDTIGGSNFVITQPGMYSIGAGVRTSADAQLSINVNGQTVAASKLTNVFNNVTIPALWLSRGDVVAFTIQALTGTVNVLGSQRYHALRYLGPS